MAKLTDEEKAANAAAKKALTEAKKATAAEKAKAESEGLSRVRCICSNVHLGDGTVLRAQKHPVNGNWVKGDTAKVPTSTAKIMEDNGQVVIL